MHFALHMFDSSKYATSLDFALFCFLNIFLSFEKM